MKKYFLLSILTISFIASSVSCTNSQNETRPSEEPNTGVEAKIAKCETSTWPQTNLTTPFDVFDTSSTGFTNIQNYFSNLKGANPNFDASNINFESIQSGLDSNNKFRGGVLSKNQIIFFYPQTFSIKNIYAFNPMNETFCKVIADQTLSGVWGAATSLPDGRLISLPIAGSQVLELNPYTLKVSVVAQSPGTYGGQILASNGMIYGVPYDADHVLKMDPNTFQMTQLGSFPAGGAKWYSSSLGANGKVYGIPLYAEQVVQIDPSDDSIKLIGQNYPGVLKWAGSVFATNGKIYGVPDDIDQILEIDPATESTRLIGNLGTEKQKWSFGFLGPDAKVYMTPDAGDTLLQYDPATDTIQEIGFFDGPDKWNGVVQAGGNFYAIPDSSPSILKISFEGNVSMDSFIQLSPFFNKY